MTTTESRLRAIVAAHLNIEPEAIHAEAKLMADLAADSLDVVELSLLIEDEMHVQITDDEGDAMFDANFASLVALVDGKRDSRAEVLGDEVEAA